MFATGFAHAQIPVTGGGGVGLQGIAGTDTLVTVVLKQGGAKDPNLKVVKVEGGLLTVQTQNGQTTSYRVADVASVQVQGAVVSVKTMDLTADRGMTTEQQEIVARALTETTEIFNNSVSNQTWRMYAAEILAVGGADGEPVEGAPILSKKQAQEYLQTLVNGNDMRTAMSAAIHMYNAGMEIPTGELIPKGLASGDRLIKASAAKLAGLTGDRSVVNDLRSMLQDRAANISAPAAVALANLGERDIIPSLMSMIGHRNAEIADAAMYALEKLGDAETATQLKMKLADFQGTARFRVARVLFMLGDAEGGTLLRDELLAVPSLQFEAARVLTLKGDAKGAQYLRTWLSERRDPSETIQLQRADATHALIKSGDRTNAGVFQDLLRDAPASVQIRVLQRISDLDVHALLPMILPTLGGQDIAVSIMAAQTAVTMANNEYGARMRNSRG